MLSTSRPRSSNNGYRSTRTAVTGLARVLFSQLPLVSAAPIEALLRVSKKKEEAPEDDESMVLYLLIAVVLVLLGGAFAGLTIALMGQDGVYLQVIAESGEGKEQRHAQKVHQLLSRGKHWVLVTLLLSNVIVNETLPIILDRSLGGGWPAVLGSTALIVIFGEVIPQSICVRYGLSIGAFMAAPVIFLMWALAPIAWPTAKLLDYLLGEDHGTVYKKSGLKTLVGLHQTMGVASDRLNEDEVTIIGAVLELKDKAIGDIMTPLGDVFTLSADTVLDEEIMGVINNAGYSRIPIHEPDHVQNFVGMLLVKALIIYDPEDCRKVSEFALATLPETRPETSCLDMINFFQEGKSHMVLVSESPGENFGAIGVVTLEDVIEELIGEEIIDESDVFVDVHKAIRRLAPAPKARIHKPRSIAAEEQLIDISEETTTTPEGWSPTKNQNGLIRSASPAVLGTSPKTTFLRRSSSANDGSVVQVRGNLNDMRAHLKHLTPSNLASQPKATRYNMVKMKTGLPARTESRQDSLLSQPIIEMPYDATLNGGEGEGLLGAGQSAKDGVQALQQGYGSFKSTASNLKEAQNASDAKPSQDDNTKSSSDLYKISTRGSQSSDTVGSLPGTRSGSPRRKTGTARSGSLTQNLIEAGGVRKMVLETNDSVQEDESSGSSSSRSERKKASEGGPNFLSNVASRFLSNEENIAPSQQSPQQPPPTYESLEAGETQAVKKKSKKKKNKKKKAGSGDGSNNQ